MIVYTHTDNNTGEVFYVGSTNNRVRPFDFLSRSKQWKQRASTVFTNITVTLYDVSNIGLPLISIECLFIKHYGLILDGGTLVNIKKMNANVINADVDIKQISPAQMVTMDKPQSLNGKSKIKRPKHTGYYQLVVNVPMGSLLAISGQEMAQILRSRVREVVALNKVSQHNLIKSATSHIDVTPTEIELFS